MNNLKGQVLNLINTVGAKYILRNNLTKVCPY